MLTMDFLWSLNFPAYQGKTSISTVGTSTSAYRLSLATMSRSNTGTGTVWEQDSEPSQQASQDTLSRTDEEDEESRSPHSMGLMGGGGIGMCDPAWHANESLQRISAILTLSSSDPLVIFYKKDLKWNCDHDSYCLLFYKFFDSLGHLEGIQTKSKSLVTPTFF